MILHIQPRRHHSSSAPFLRFPLAGALLLLGWPTVAGAADWGNEGSDLAPDAAVRWGSLENGFRYAVLPHDDPPERVSLRLVVEAGSLMEADDQRGLAHFLEHMAFNGSKHFPEGGMVEYFQRIGMGFGADTNAYTSYRETVYMLELPRNDDAMLAEGLQLFRDYADGLLLKAEEIDRERGVISSEKRARDSVDYRTYVDEIGFVLPDALVSKRMPIGKEEVIGSAPRSRFVDFYEAWYRPERMALVAVGEVDPDKVAALVEEYFGTFRASREPAPKPDLGNVSGEGLMVRLHTEREAPATTVSIQTSRGITKRPDTREKRVADLFRGVAGRIISRRLEILAKEPESAFTHGNAYIYDFLDFAESAGIELTCEPERWDAALGVAERELRRALEFGFTEAEFAEIRAKTLNRFEQAVKTAPTRKSRSLAGELARSIVRKQVFTHPEADLALAREAFSLLSREHAHAALRKAWGSADRFIYVTGNLVLEEPEDAIKRAYAASLAGAVERPGEVEAEAFAYTGFGPAGEIASRETLDDLDITRIVFSNGVRLNLKATDFEKNSIRVRARFGGGLLSAPVDRPGLPLLAGAVFTNGGLEAHSADDLERIMAGKTVGVGFGVDQDAFNLSGSTTPDDLADQMRLMAAYLTAPGYREEALRQARKQFEQLYVQLEHTPQGVMRNQVARVLASGDPRFGFAPREELKKRDLAEVRAWLAEPLGVSALEVSMVGDFELEEAIARAAETFGALPPRQVKKPPYIEERKVLFPEGGDPVRFSVETKIPKAIAAVYWPTDDIWDIARTRRLSMLSHVFSDRLRVKVREEIGEAYSPDAYHVPSDTFSGYGYFSVSIVAEPSETGKLADIVRRIGGDLARDGITEDELERALKPLLNGLEEWVRSNRYWLGTVLASSQEYPERLDWARTMTQDYTSVTVADINAVAAQYLAPERSLPIAVVPVEGGK